MRIVTRYLIPAMLVIGLAGSVYVMSSATGNGSRVSKLEAFATGKLEKLDFATAGDMIPVTGFLGPDGGAMTLADFSGRTVLVNLWATWCAPCEKEMPSLGALETARGSDHFVVIPISVDDEEDRDFAAGELARLTGSALDFYHAPDYKITYAMGVRGFPTSVIYGPDGREIVRLSGDIDWASFETVAFIDAVLTSVDPEQAKRPTGS